MLLASRSKSSVISSGCNRGGFSGLNGGRHKSPVSLPMRVAAAVVVLPFVMRLYGGCFGVIGHDDEAPLTCALRACSLERGVFRMGGVRVMLDWLCYALPSLAARRFGSLSHRGREANSGYQGQSRCAARYSFHCRPPFELSGGARASTSSRSEVESRHRALLSRS